MDGNKKIKFARFARIRCVILLSWKNDEQQPSKPPKLFEAAAIWRPGLRGRTEVSSPDK